MKSCGLNSLEQIIRRAMTPEETQQCSMRTHNADDLTVELGWVRTLRELSHYLKHHKFAVERRSCVDVNLILPIARFGWQKTECVNAGLKKKLINRSVARTFKELLRNRLARTARHVLAWEWQVFLATPGISSGQSGRDLTEAFFEAGVERECERIIESYPALARLWAVQITYWIEFVSAFLTHTELFLKTASTNTDDHINTVIKVETDFSDTHHGNRTVLKVHLAKGAKWFYKPRPGLSEVKWFSLLRWINELGFPDRFKIPIVQPSHDHCWMEAVDHLPCRTTKEASGFYRRAGALLILIHSLRGVDFHAANLIASGEQPVAIDCEGLFHPRGGLPNHAGREDRTILRTGMLPTAVPAPTKRFSFFGCLESGTHSVQTEGQLAARVSDFLPQIIAGCEAMHKLLRHEAIAPRFLKMIKGVARGVPWRHIARPTSHYHAILQISLSRSALAEGAQRTSVLEQLCRTDGVSTKLRADELRALVDADIPAMYRHRRAPSRLLSEEEFAHCVQIIEQALSRTYQPTHG